MKASNHESIINQTITSLPPKRILDYTHSVQNSSSRVNHHFIPAKRAQFLKSVNIPHEPIHGTDLICSILIKYELTPWASPWCRERSPWYRYHLPSRRNDFVAITISMVLNLWVLSSIWRFSTKLASPHLRVKRYCFNSAIVYLWSFCFICWRAKLAWKSLRICLRLVDWEGTIWFLEKSQKVS